MHANQGLGSRFEHSLLGNLPELTLDCKLLLQLRQSRIGLQESVHDQAACSITLVSDWESSATVLSSTGAASGFVGDGSQDVDS